MLRDHLAGRAHGRPGSTHRRALHALLVLLLLLLLPLKLQPLEVLHLLRGPGNLGQRGMSLS